MSSPFNSRESRKLSARDRGFGRINSPQHSNESLQRASDATSYESIGVGSSYYSGSNFSGASDGVAPAAKKLTSDVLRSMKHHNLHQVRTRNESPSYSMSSDHSDLRSFPSEVSYEHLDQPRTSLSSSVSPKSQRRIWQDADDELRRLKREMKRITMTYNVVCHESETASVNVCKAATRIIY